MGLNVGVLIVIGVLIMSVNICDFRVLFRYIEGGKVGYRGRVSGL